MLFSWMEGKGMRVSLDEPSGKKPCSLPKRPRHVFHFFSPWWPCPCRPCSGVWNTPLRMPVGPGLAGWRMYVCGLRRRQTATFKPDDSRGELNAFRKKGRSSYQPLVHQPAVESMQRLMTVRCGEVKIGGVDPREQLVGAALNISHRPCAVIFASANRPAASPCLLSYCGIIRIHPILSNHNPRERALQQQHAGRKASKILREVENTEHSSSHCPSIRDPPADSPCESWTPPLVSIFLDNSAVHAFTGSTPGHVRSMYGVCNNHIFHGERRGACWISRCARWCTTVSPTHHQTNKQNSRICILYIP